jgi:hypothetical protein
MLVELLICWFYEIRIVLRELQIRIEKTFKVALFRTKCVGC